MRSIIFSTDSEALLEVVGQRRKITIEVGARYFHINSYLYYGSKVCIYFLYFTNKKTKAQIEEKMCTTHGQL